MAKPKRKAQPCPRAMTLAYDPPVVRTTPMNAGSRMGAALRSEASFLRSTGFPEKAAAIEAAVPAIGLASSEHILKDLRA
jgi:hypothetical protein